MTERFAIPIPIPIPVPGPYPLGVDSQRQPGVPQGTVTRHEWRSEIFPGTVRDYFVYVPAQYTGDAAAAVMVFQDSAHNFEHGASILPESLEWLWR